MLASLRSCDKAAAARAKIPQEWRSKVNTQGGGDGNAMQAASRSGHEKVVQTLLGAGADINAQVKLYTLSC